MAILGIEGFDHYRTDASGGTIDDEIETVEGYAIDIHQTNMRIYDTGTRFGYGKYLACIYSNASLRISTVGEITNTMFVSAAIRFENTIGSAVLIEWWDDNADDRHVGLQLDATGTFQFTRNGTPVGPASTNTISLGVWYWMECKVKVDNTTGIVQLKIDGVDWIAETTGLDTLNAGGADIGMFRIMGDSTPYIYWDDLVWQDDDGGFLGDSRIETFMPSSAGSQSNWTIGGDTPAATRHESLDDVPWDEDTTYVYSSTDEQIDLYNVGTITDNDTIHGVSVHWRAKKTDTGARGMQSRTYADSGADLQGGTERSLATGYISYRDVFETSDGTTTWTKTLFDNAQFGIQVKT